MSQSASSEDSDGSASDAESDAQGTLVEAEKVKKQLLQSPSYELHVQLISLLRRAGELEKLREAREAMSSIYPLSPALWLEWINDERNIASSDTEKDHIESLFKRAVDDYQDVNVWLEYCHFIIGRFSIVSPNAVSDAEEALESALTHQGLNVASGSMLWEVYREFQYVVLSQTGDDRRQEHLQKMNKLFRRQLSTSHIDMESTLIEYETFLQGVGGEVAHSDLVDTTSLVPPDCLADYNKALARLAVMTEHENRLDVTSESELLSAWTDYLNWATRPVSPEAKRQKKSSTAIGSTPSIDVYLSPNEVCCLFERAVTTLCLHSTIWLRFADYLESELPSDNQRLLRVLARSVRNCPWSVDLWLRYALSSESQVTEQVTSGCITSMSRGNDVQDSADANGGCPDYSAIDEAFSKVEAIFETALSAGISDVSAVLRLWQTYCDYQLRRLLATDKKAIDAWAHRLAVLRTTFDRAIDHVGKCSKSGTDAGASLMEYYAFVEVKHAGDIAKAHAVWSRLMQLHGHGTQFRFWLAYLQFERDWGNVRHLARICAMAINSLPTSSADYSESRERFVSLLRVCGEAGMPIAKIRELEKRVRSVYLLRTTSQQPLEAVEDVQATRNRPIKRKMSSPDSSQSTPKKVKESTMSKGKWADLGQVPIHGHGECVPHDKSKEGRTVFVSNLSYSVTEDQLRQRFAECGTVTSVRLVRNYAGRSKGYAYIEFSESTHAKQALQLDRQPVAVSVATGEDMASTDQASDASETKRPMFVSPCDPSRSGAAAGVGFRYSAGKKEPEKLFVRQLDRKVTQAELKRIFGQYGDVVSVRMATYRNGEPKGHAYVEFASANEASRALVATDGLLVGSKRISVAISEPPVRQVPTGQHQLAGKRKQQAAPGGEDNSPVHNFLAPKNPASGDKPLLPPSQRQLHPRTQLAFIPRALHRASSSDAANPTEPTPSSVGNDSSSKPKSNEDFRRLFSTS